MTCAGDNEIYTPNLDRMAAGGVRFENCFCTSPVCSPARASLLTGRIPSRHGIHDFLADGNVGENAIEYLQGQTAYTDILAVNGYVCGISGKWHLGHSIKPHADTKIDGVREAVTGKGQINLAGLAGREKKAFNNKHYAL